MAPAVVLTPIRSFNGMSRLADVLDDASRSALAQRLAGSLFDAASGAGLSVRVITADAEVEEWAVRRGADVIGDPGLGLDAAAELAVETMGDGRWMLAHADLPYVSARALGEVAARALDGVVLVPSLDGGTNVVAARGRFGFAFGEGSFHRHLARYPRAAVVPSAHLSIDIDTPSHLAAFARMRRRPTLAP